MRFTGIQALEHLLYAMEGLGFKSSLSIYDLRDFFYEQALYISNLICDFRGSHDNLTLVFYDKKEKVLEIRLWLDK